MSSGILLTDRTTIETDGECPRKVWWYKDYKSGQGIVPVKEASYYKEGRFIHHDLSLIATGVPYQEVLEQMGPAPEGNSLLLEPFLRRQGWVTAFGKWMWPQMKERYDVVKVEWELILDRSPLWVATTPDLLLRDKSDGKLVLRDYKSVGMLGQSWTAHWPYAIQMHILLAALAEELGEKPKYAEVMGLVKGQEKGGKLRHPYVWAYSDGADRWSGDWKAGWELRLGNEFPGGVPSLVEYLGEDVGRGQFPTSAPIFLDERLLDRLLAQQTIRTKERVLLRSTVEQTSDEEYREYLMDSTWRQNFDKCRPSFGSECPYLAACHNGEVNADPEASGLYVKRVPHHDLELTMGDDRWINGKQSSDLI